MRIVIADDSALIREGLARLLTEAGHHVVAKVGDAPAFIAAVDSLLPDLAVADIRMPPLMEDDGTRAAIALRGRHPRLPIVLLSQHVDTRSAAELATGGSFGYLLKDRVLDVDDFLDALERVAAGGTALDPEAVAALLRPRDSAGPLASLTAREREVLALMAEGRSNAAIAKRLWLTERTIESHIHRLLTKLGLADSGDDHRRVLAVLTYLRVSTQPN